MLGISKGTKLTDNPKSKTFKIRMDEATAQKLEYLAEREKVSKADVIRKGIEMQYQKK